MSKIKSKRTGKKRLKVDAEKRLEINLEILAYFAVFNLTLVALMTNLSLIMLRKADMLMPFKMLIVTGFAFLLMYSSMSIYFHYIEKRFENPILLCVKIISACASIVAMIFSIPSALMLEAWLSFDIVFDTPTILALGVGIFATFIGLIVAMRRAMESLRAR